MKFEHSQIASLRFMTGESWQPTLKTNTTFLRFMIISTEVIIIEKFTIYIYLYFDRIVRQVPLLKAPNKSSNSDIQLYVV